MTSIPILEDFLKTFTPLLIITLQLFAFTNNKNKEARETYYNTQINETQGALCMVDQITKQTKFLRITLSAKNNFAPYPTFN